MSPELQVQSGWPFVSGGSAELSGEVACGTAEMGNKKRELLIDVVRFD